MQERERILFIGKTSQDPRLFIQSGCFESAKDISPNTSPRERLENLFFQYLCLPKEEKTMQEEQPLILVDDDQQELLEAAREKKQELEATSSGSNSNGQQNLQREYEKFLRLLTIVKLVKLDIGKDPVAVDRETGIRITKITQIQFAFPTHPTPAH